MNSHDSVESIRSSVDADADVAVVVTAHDETLVSGPSLSAAEASIVAAEDAGYSVRAVIALDNALPQTADYFAQSRFDRWERRTYEYGDLGLVRNAIVNDLNEGIFAFLDADDIFSENWIVEGVRLLRSAEAAGTKAVVHPELNWFFDGTDFVFANIDQDSPLFDPVRFYFANYYDSLCISPRQAHLDAPYVTRDIPNGLSFQDWQYSVETMALGYKHLCARDTIIFKRKRDDSLVAQSRARRSILRSLPQLRIDAVRSLPDQKR